MKLCDLEKVAKLSKELEIVRKMLRFPRHMKVVFVLEQNIYSIGDDERRSMSSAANLEIPGDVALGWLGTRASTLRDELIALGVSP